MNKNTILALVVGLIVGVGGTIAASGLKKENEGKKVTNTPQTSVTDNSTMSMADMNKQLEKLTGDDFDKAFIEMMIAHREAAIGMAQLSSTRAKHPEIKKLSQEIISAQTKEIGDMQQWQMDWGYKTNNDTMPGMN